MWGGCACGLLGFMTPNAFPPRTREIINAAPTRQIVTDTPTRQVVSVPRALSMVALVLSGTAVVVLVTRPTWVTPEVAGTVFTSSVAVVPTLLYGAVLSLIGPSLRGSRATHLGALIVGTLGFVVLAAAGQSFMTAFDAADAGVEPSLFARLFLYLGISSVLLVWASLTAVGLVLGPPVVRTTRRVVAVASTSLALTLTLMACMPNPVAQAFIAASVLAIVMLLGRNKTSRATLRA
jgi:hypothetical protein